MYRADGMRVRKVGGIKMHWQEPDGGEAGFYIYSANLLAPTWRNFYDGQMPQEEDLTISQAGEDEPILVVTGRSYALGARGIDMIIPWKIVSNSRVDDGPRQYPVYDGHGNMIATLTRNGSPYAVTTARTYDVWGGVRTGSPTGGASQRYCASLGHVQDDESGLIYMRARYYEPLTGRFISEDPARDGFNWFVYCWNEPVLKVDPDGRRYTYEITGFQGFFDLYMGLGILSFGGAALILMAPLLPPSPQELQIAYLLIGASSTFFASAFGQTSLSPNLLNEYFLAITSVSGVVLGIMAILEVGGRAKNGIAMILIAACALYSTIILGAFLMGQVSP